MNDPLKIKPQNNESSHFIELLEDMVLDKGTKMGLSYLLHTIYIDGWTDGNSHRGSLSPREFKERISKDWRVSFSKLIWDELEK